MSTLLKRKNIELLPSLTQVSSKTKHVDVVFKARVPESKKKTLESRKPIALSIVIDSSGSMAGKPLDEAKKAAIQLLHKLKSGDFISLVSFSDEATLHSGLVDVVEYKDRLIASINAIQAMGSTSLRAGWLQGASTLAATVSKFGVSRILLLSDGVATDRTTPASISPEAKDLSSVGISTSTYGLGLNFNEELMTQLALNGDGASFYAETADVLSDYFDTEFQMLNALVGKQVKLKVSASFKGQALPVLSLSHLKEESEFRLGNLLEGTDRWVAFRVDLSSLKNSNLKKLKEEQKIEVEVTFEYANVGEDNAAAETVKLNASLDLVVDKESSEGVNEWALERIKETEASRLQREAIEKARMGDWNSVNFLVDAMSASAGSNAYVRSVASNLKGLAAAQNAVGFSKEALYSSVAMSSRMVDVNEDSTTMEVANDRFGARKAHQGRSSKSSS